MNAAQKPIHSAIFAQKYEAAAWKDIPSWYLVGAEDQAINPALQRVFAERMKATTEEVRSSHVPFASQPAVVARFIGRAAQSISARAASGD
jgi:pimeloyl-ACP methyl ester carboxylesterase